MIYYDICIINLYKFFTAVLYIHIINHHRITKYPCITIAPRFGSEVILPEAEPWCQDAEACHLKQTQIWQGPRNHLQNQHEPTIYRKNSPPKLTPSKLSKVFHPSWSPSLFTPTTCGNLSPSSCCRILRNTLQKSKSKQPGFVLGRWKPTQNSSCQTRQQRTTMMSQREPTPGARQQIFVFWRCRWPTNSGENVQTGLVSKQIHQSTGVFVTFKISNVFTQIDLVCRSRFHFETSKSISVLFAAWLLMDLISTYSNSADKWSNNPMPPDNLFLHFQPFRATSFGWGSL